MQHARTRPSRNALKTAVAVLFLCHPALADDAEPGPERPPQKLSGQQILGESKSDSGTFEWFRTNFKTVKTHGFEYSRSLDLRDRDRNIEFSIQGPMIRKKTPGLVFEVRF